MDRLLGVLLGSLFTGGVALAYPLQAPVSPDQPPTPGIEIRREVAFGGPVLGVQATELTPELQDFFGTDGLGVLVSRVFEGTAADAAGVQVGDVLVSVDDEPVSNIQELRDAVERAAGDDVVVEVVRGGRLVELDASLAEMAPPDAFERPNYVEVPDVDIERYVGHVDADDQDMWRRAEGGQGPEWKRLEQQLEDLQQRQEIEFQAIQDRLEALEERGLGTGRVK